MNSQDKLCMHLVLIGVLAFGGLCMAKSDFSPLEGSLHIGTKGTPNTAQKAPITPTGGSQPVKTAKTKAPRPDSI